MVESLAHYTFLPFYRTGLASAVDRGTDGRGELEVSIQAKIGSNEESFSRTIRLIGPGDLRGIDPRAIIRVEPRPLTNDFEPNYLAAIEFFDEDFPWRYSPQAPAGDRLLPWVALIVLEEGEFEGPKDQGPELPPFISIQKEHAAKLPPPDQLWAWAHTHLNSISASSANPRATAAALTGNPALGCSRLLAPRRLQPNKAYWAFLVPTFETGRRAGLVPQAIQPNRPFAWDRASSTTLPVYFHWQFRTGTEGDFEALAARLKAKAPDKTVGRRPMDLSRPLPGMPEKGKGSIPKILNIPPQKSGVPEPARPVLDLEGALQIPGAKPSADFWEAQSKADFQSWLADFINLGEVWTINTQNRLSGAPELPSGIKLPIVLPPSYGRWQANIEALEPAQAEDRWLEQINLDPSNRVAAAFGTQVVQKNQEDFMARAWRQYGELFEANRFRFRAQFFRELLTSVELKHFTALSEANLLATTAFVHPKVLAETGERRTVFGVIDASILPQAAVQTTMRRILRANGPITKRFGGAKGGLKPVLEALAAGRASLAPPLNQPEDRLTLATWGDRHRVPGEIGWLCGLWKRLPPFIRNFLEQLLILVEKLPAIGIIARFLLDSLAVCHSKPALSAEGLTPQAVEEAQVAGGWVPLANPGETPQVRIEDRAPAPENPIFSSAAWNFRQAALNATEWLTLPIPEPKPRPMLDVASTAATLRKSLIPYITVPERVRLFFMLPPWVKLPSYDPLEAIMAYPSFDDATYAFLRKLSEEHLVPNLSKIENNTVTLLETNWRFIESFLVGLNHEMGRELLWRGYPTDRRGSYFRQFWDVAGIPRAHDSQGRIVEMFRDIHPIHGWKSEGKLTELGGNRPIGKKVTSNLVLVIRGDLLRRYPNTEVFAVKAVPNPKPRPKDDGFEHLNRKPGNDLNEPTNSQRQNPVFGPVQLAADIFGYGFNLEKGEVIGVDAGEGERVNLGWYFVLRERFAEPRFGLDEPKSPPKQDADLAKIVDDKGRPSKKARDLSWASLVKTLKEYADLAAIDLDRNKPNLDHSKVADILDIDNPPTSATWNKDAADMAMILLQSPVSVYFHASKMLQGIEDGP
ncbi:hypothetical protein [Methylocaldum sp. RMAD-M]|uniref:hypothetical protein n=1 Tax=Methylocaldum sp. RMAD-M TaxID=2806557 RepID=UPI000A32AA04|nr:hypothetical protein [Methylocaldum sp. RMAD-M]MBP1151251.1 hypothetical protein [Methylocaldum sp. RMAD-M]